MEEWMIRMGQLLDGLSTEQVLMLAMGLWVTLAALLEFGRAFFIRCIEAARLEQESEEFNGEWMDRQAWEATR